ncbi:MAG: UDP-N-acetylglucosamine 2-epimerase [Gemmiger sp.]|nr:UDP-N-acetylglucosamine 2-epimerase [Gemmiger sp.]
MPQPKRLAVVTATRAEYGLLRPVLLKLQGEPRLATQLLVTGAHLCPAYGETVAEIEADGLQIAARLPIFGPGGQGEGPTATADAIARAMAVFAGWFAQNRPDALLLLGDRFEIFAVAAAAACQRVPVCHISGGDVTLGAADEYYRHCITKMAALHFPSCAESAARLVKMGEAPATVFCVGGLGDENIRTLPKMSLAQVGESLGLGQRLARGPLGLVTFHPETAGGGGTPAVAAQCQALCTALAALPGVFWLLTGSNADAGGQLCNAALQQFAAAHPGNALFVPSLGLRRYLSAMAGAAVVAGNSSSGVVETPSLGVPAVNIGARQAGRAICSNVLCCGGTAEEITGALRTALTPAFAAKAATAHSPYGGGDTSGKIVRVLANALHTPGFGAPKAFYEGPVPTFDPAAPV